jgi:hypothetical protein
MPYGRVQLRAALYAPGWFPGLRIVGPLLESVGRAVPAAAAFQILVIERS